MQPGRQIARAMVGSDWIRMLRSLIALSPRNVPVRVALRNTVAVVAPLAIGIAGGHEAAGLAVASGALNTMFTDQPGPYRLRVQRMLLAALGAGLAALLGILVGGHLPSLVAATLVVSFVGGMLVALGPIAARLGLGSMIMLLVTASMEIAPVHAAGVAALIFAGGVLQTLFAIAAWPLQRYRPERFALADVLQQLASTARTRPDAAQQPAVSQAAMDALVMLHGEYRARGEAMRSFRIIAEVCERARIDLLALCDLHARIAGADARRRIADVLDRASAALQAFAEAMRSTHLPAGTDGLVTAFEQCTQALAGGADPDGEDGRRLRIATVRADSLAGQLRSLLRNIPRASSRGEAHAQRVEARLPAALQTRAPLPTLRANLDIGSVAFRHALRCAVCVASAVVLQHWLQVPHGVWVPMTAAIVLKPDFGGTLRFGVLRVAGTVGGLLLVSVLAHYATGDAALRLLLMAALCLGFRLLVQVNYAIGVALLTGMVVMLLSFQGMAPAEAVDARMVGTLAGSALALAAYALWPTWESRQMPATLATLVDAYRLHLHAVLGGRLDELVDTRAAARRARTNAEAALERLRGEPRMRRSIRDVQRSESLLANASRLVRASVALEALLRDGARLPQPEALATFAAHADAALLAIVAGLRDNTPVQLESMRPDERRLAQLLARSGQAGNPLALAVADACDRIADSIDTLAHLLQHPGPPAAAAAPAG